MLDHVPDAARVFVNPNRKTTAFIGYPVLVNISLDNPVRLIGSIGMQWKLRFYPFFSVLAHENHLCYALGNFLVGYIVSVFLDRSRGRGERS